MNMSLDCIPCMLAQVLDACRRATPDQEDQLRIFAQATALVGSELPGTKIPILLNKKLNQVVTTETGVEDPYRQVKREHIQGALALYPYLKDLVDKAEERLWAALRVAVAGNVLDVAVDAQVRVSEDLEKMMPREFAIGNFEGFQRAVEAGSRILVLGDNAGETVFDRVLLEELAALGKEVAYGVKETPIINDATATDAIESGIDRVATVISTGCSTAGTVLDHCSDQFREIFMEADLVLAKGMGNYEALSEAPRPVFFLLKAKCKPVAEDTGVAVGDFVFGRREDMNGRVGGISL